MVFVLLGVDATLRGGCGIWEHGKWNMNFVWKTDEGGSEGAESIVLLIFVLWRCFNCRWMMFMDWGRKSYLRPAEITSFSSRDLSRRNKHGSFWLFVSTGYFCILFVWAIVVSNFQPLEIHKHFVLPLSSITVTVNSQADNHFYKYIYLFQILYSMKSVF